MVDTGSDSGVRSILLQQQWGRAIAASSTAARLENMPVRQLGNPLPHEPQVSAPPQDHPSPVPSAQQPHSPGPLSPVFGAEIRVGLLAGAIVMCLLVGLVRCLWVSFRSPADQTGSPSALRRLRPNSSRRFGLADASATSSCNTSPGWSPMRKSPTWSPTTEMSPSLGWLPVGARSPIRSVPSTPSPMIPVRQPLRKSFVAIDDGSVVGV